MESEAGVCFLYWFLLMVQVQSSSQHYIQAISARSDRIQRASITSKYASFGYLGIHSFNTAIPPRCTLQPPNASQTFQRQRKGRGNHFEMPSDNHPTPCRRFHNDCDARFETRRSVIIGNAKLTRILHADKNAGQSTNKRQLAILRFSRKQWGYSLAMIVEE